MRYTFRFTLILISIACGSKDDAMESPDLGKDPDPIVTTFDPNYHFIRSNSTVQDRGFYFFTLLENVEGSASSIEKNAELSQLLDEKKGKINAVINDNRATIETYANALKYTDSEITSIAETFQLLTDKAEELKKVVDDHMKPSGAFQQFSEVTNENRYIQLAFTEAANAVNYIIDTYGRGITPKYPDIDKVNYDVNTPEYLNLLRNAFIELNENEGKLTMFFQPSLKFVLKLLDINDRDEAGRYVPMKEGVNKQAFDYLQTIKWEDFDYSLILVLGDSPNSPGDQPNISVGAMSRADHGVKLFQQGKSPLMLFSGGHVYPVHTPYSEAIEMKKYVMEKYNISEKFILVDPHARHTTTNMRNAGRLMFRYGIPVDKKAIVSTSASHSTYVASQGLITRSTHELRHIPFELFDRISELDLEFKPKIKTLHLDASDPLDP